MLLSKTKIKWINSLERKKNRDEEAVFVAEGKKIVSDLMPRLKCRFLALTDEDYLEVFSSFGGETELISTEDYKKISFQKSPQGVLAVFEKPMYSINVEEINGRLMLALDDIQDPGNLGTIIRLADWFGIKDVFCSFQTADVFSPKTIQSTMGAIARVRVHYVDLSDFFEKLHADIPIYGTYMDGKSIYSEKLTEHGVILLGNEGNGISCSLEKYITRKISIPNYPATSDTSESLNVGLAAAITVAEFRRRKLY